MPVKPCLACGRLSTESYCPAHQPARGGSRTLRGSGWAAQRWARAVKARTGGPDDAVGLTFRVGHADITMTMRYVHHVPAHDAAQRLSAVVAAHPIAHRTPDFACN